MNLRHQLQDLLSHGRQGKIIHGRFSRDNDSEA